jgi:hypothetical protein
MDEAPSALVCIDPVADLQNRQLEHPLVNYVTSLVTYLDAVTDFKGPPEDNEHPPSKIDQKIT